MIAYIFTYQNLSKALFSFLFLFLFSCDYEPTGTNYTEIDPNFKPANITINLPENKDTIYLNARNTNSIQYDLSGETDKLLDVYMFLDDRLIARSNQAIGSSQKMTFNANAMYSYYTLKLVAATRSGTGSIADSLKMEGVVYSRTWVLCVYNTQFVKPPELEFDRSNGKMKIIWKNYPFMHDCAVVVRKSWVDTEYNYETVGTVTNGDNFIYDSTYVGEKTKYNVQVFNKQSFEFSYPNTWCEKDLPEIWLERDDNYNYTLKWEKCKYYDNFDSYYITSSDTRILEQKTIKDLNETSINMSNFAFPQKCTITLTITPKVKKGSSLNNENKYIRKDFQTGEITFDFYNFYGGNNRYLVHNAYRTNVTKNYIFDLTLNKVVDSLGIDVYNFYNIDLSESAKYMIICNKTSLKFKEFDGTFSGGKTFNYNQIWGNSITADSINSLLVSDNAICLMKTKDSVALYDLIQNKLLIKEKIPGSFCSLSPDAKFLITVLEDGSENFYKYENNNFTKVYYYDKLTWFKFNLKEPHKAIFYAHDPNLVLDLENLTTSSPNILGYWYSFDFVNNRFISLQGKKMLVYDLTNYSLLKEIPIYAIFGYEKLVLHNGYIYAESGIRIKI